MSFLRNLFGKREPSTRIPETKEPAQAPKKHDVTTGAGIEAMLRAHLQRLQAAYGEHPGAEDLRQLCSQLLADEQLAFVVKSIQENLPRSLAKKIPYDTDHLFSRFAESSFLVAVTVFPWLAPSEIRAHLREGYSSLLLKLGAKVAILDARSPSEIELGILPWTHLVHWIYCCDGKDAGVHLSLMPEAANLQAERTVVIVAEDLLTPNERKQMGLAHLA